MPTPTAAPHPNFHLGAASLVANPEVHGKFRLPPHHFVTHGVIVGMTGGGKTGLITVLAEEALRSDIPVLVIDVKGDLTNLLLAFPSFDAEHFAPYVDAVRAPNDTRDDAAIAAELADARRRGLDAAGISESTLRAFHEGTHVRVITPGSNVGEPLHLLSSLERRSPRWDTDVDAARCALIASVSLVLRLLGRESDPAKNREHVLLSALAERRLLAGDSAQIGELIHDLESPPIDELGAMSVDDYVSPSERHALAASMNSLLASPALASWRRGATLDLDDWMRMKPREGRTPAVIVSVAHLDEAERTLVLGVLLEEILAWVRSLSGAQRLRALVLFDEVYGFLPPHPANPPTKRPLVSLMKQARAFGVGVVVATQNPMDLDYRALSNAGVWCIGRLQTDADRARVVEGLTGIRTKAHSEEATLAGLIKSLPPRTFVIRDATEGGTLALLEPRQTMSFLRGPMTRGELVAAQTREAK